MSTELKTETNRANAQFSTGPRSDQGKSRSAQNARKHGLCAKQLAIQPQDLNEFDELLAGFQEKVRPRGAIQQTLFDELVAAAWNLRRVRILASDLDLLDPQQDRLARHHSRLERTFYRALQELKALQTDQAVRHLTPPEIRHKTPLLASILLVEKSIAKRSQQPVPQLRSLPPKPKYGVAPAMLNHAA